MELSGLQLDALQTALISAYPKESDLKHLLRKLDLQLNLYADGPNYSATVFDLIEALGAQGRLPELITAAQSNNQGNVKLRAFVDSLSSENGQGVSQAQTSRQGPAFDWRGPTDERELEGLLRLKRDVASYDMTFIQRASQPASAVCRMELPNQEPIGTGFLVAKNLLLTNYHVIAPDEDSDPNAFLDQIILRFAYVTTNTGEGAEGKTFKLAPSPLIKFKTVEQGLDYALLRIEDDILSETNLQPISLNSERLPDRDMNIHILQHPDGQTLRVTFSNNGITGVYERDGMIQYVSDTSVGSSGSPCFNDNWELVAVHHAQVPAPFGVKCEGILFKSIFSEISSILQQYFQSHI